MIQGIGIDLVEIERIEGAYQKFGGKFLQRIFTPAEQKEILSRRNPVPAMAARFAAKEAVAKALGSGIGKVGWLDIELIRSNGEPPMVILHGVARKWAGDYGLAEIKVSWSHERHYAAAQAVALLKQ